MEILTITTPADELPISLADIKAHLRIDGTSQDDYLTDLMWVAYSWIEQEADITISETVYQLQLPCFGSSKIVLPKPPVQTLDSLTYRDSDNQSQTLTEGTDFYLVTPSKQAAFLMPITYWPSTFSRPDAVTIVFTAGYAVVPHQVLHLMRLLVGTMFENREGEITGTITSTIKLGVDRLLSQIRNVRYV